VYILPVSLFFSGELLDGFLPNYYGHACVTRGSVTRVEKIRLTLNSEARCHLEYSLSRKTKFLNESLKTKANCTMYPMLGRAYRTLYERTAHLGIKE